jgi:hypothetical protein
MILVQGAGIDLCIRAGIDRSRKQDNILPQLPAAFPEYRSISWAGEGSNALLLLRHCLENVLWVPGDSQHINPTAFEGNPAPGIP